MVTSYLGTVNSSDETLSRAERLAEEIGAYHFKIEIDEAYKSIVKIFEKATTKSPKFEA